ncbi:MAG: response regulator [Candidatus Aureabacteria bacterium]|nr:response regulator [Candidatus Auribacterota bacterium]
MEKKIKVMVVDDSLPFRSILSSLISEHPDIQVIATAYSGKMALHRMEAEKKLPDVVVLDYEMPEMDGFQTLKIIKNKYPHISVIILSAYAESSNSHFVKRAKELCADAVMYKTTQGKSREENIAHIKNELITKIIECYGQNRMFDNKKNP